MTTQHLLTETADPHHDPRPWQDCTRKDIREGDMVETLVGGLVSVGVAHHQDGASDWYTKGGMSLTYGDIWPLRRIPASSTEKGAPMTETTPAEPLARIILGVPEGHGAHHHDAEKIKPGDFVAQVDKDGFIRAGIARRQADDGRWADRHGSWITYADFRAARPDALTVWPAPTPPAEEVKWEPQFGDIITDARYGTVGKIDRLVYAGRAGWVDEASHSWCLAVFTAFTLPDGTHARRDGDHEDGRPRFVKVREGEK